MQLLMRLHLRKGRPGVLGAEWERKTGDYGKQLYCGAGALIVHDLERWILKFYSKAESAAKLGPLLPSHLPGLEQMLRKPMLGHLLLGTTGHIPPRQVSEYRLSRGPFVPLSGK